MQISEGINASHKQITIPKSMVAVAREMQEMVLFDFPFLN